MSIKINPDPSRYHLIDDKLYVRVTEVLKIISKGPAFDNWLRTHGVKSHALSRKAADKGILIHAAIAAHLERTYGEGDKPKEYPKVVMRYVNAALNWVGQHTVVGIERQVISHKWGYAGRFDLLLVRDGVTYVGDWKTSKSLYPEYDLQVAAYGAALDGNVGGCLIKVDSGSVPTVKWIEPEAMKRNHRLFLAALELWRWKNPMPDDEIVLDNLEDP